MWSRALCAVIACGCYNPSPLEGLACSETDRCPMGQVCDLAFHECAVSPRCDMPAIADSFDIGAPPCQPWGRQFGQAKLDVRDATMAITPQSGGQNSGGCHSNGMVAFGQGGFFIEVLEVMPLHQGFVEFSIQNGSYEPAITAQDGMISLVTPGQPTERQEPYNPVAMRWWRLRPSLARDAVVAEYAADGYHWHLLTMFGVPAESHVGLRFSAGINNADSQPGTARVARLGICPPPPL